MLKERICLFSGMENIFSAPSCPTLNTVCSSLESIIALILSRCSRDSNFETIDCFDQFHRCIGEGVCILGISTGVFLSSCTGEDICDKEDESERDEDRDKAEVNAVRDEEDEG